MRFPLTPTCEAKSVVGAHWAERMHEVMPSRWARYQADIAAVTILLEAVYAFGMMELAPPDRAPHRLLVRTECPPEAH